VSRFRRPAIIAGFVGGFGLAAFVHRHRRVPTGRSMPGGVVMGDVHGYDRLSRLFFRSFFRGIAGNVVATVPPPARVLEVGCGPGWLSIELADRGFEVTGLDLDPAMIERAQANAERVSAGRADAPRPTFLVGDVAALPFLEVSFDLVVSTFSMHHWSDRHAGLADIWRVVRPGGRILIWDLRPGAVPFHSKSRRRVEDAHADGAHGPDDHGPDAHDGPLAAATITPWRWPMFLKLADRMELVRPAGGTADGNGAPAVVSADATG
jgi:SAM-dependent methyltransferase